MILTIDPAKDKIFYCHGALEASEQPGSVAQVQLGTDRGQYHLSFGTVNWTAQSHSLQALVRGKRAVYCEAQWIGATTEKWSGLEPLCQTSGAVRFACALVGVQFFPLATSEYRRVFAPAPTLVRAKARALEQSCGRRILGRIVGGSDWPDYAAAFAMWLHAEGFKVRDFGFSPVEMI